MEGPSPQGVEEEGERWREGTCNQLIKTPVINDYLCTENACEGGGQKPRLSAS